MLPLPLLLVAFLLCPGVLGGEIIGGREAQPHSRPYMAFLKIERGGRNARCGGFLIREDVVVTAAHCNSNLSITVLLGAHNTGIEEPGRQKISVRRRIPHPEYNDKTIENDIVLLQLKYKANLTKTVGLISLPVVHHRVPLGTTCSVAGWGKTSLTDKTDTLQEVNLRVISDKSCQKRYHHYYKPSSMLCVGDPQDQKSIYQGDSGGPLVCQGVAEGVVSFCIKDNINPPAVYTRISHFMPWITETMRRI